MHRLICDQLLRGNARTHRRMSRAMRYVDEASRLSGWFRRIGKTIFFNYFDMLDFNKFVGMRVFLYLRRSDKSNADKPVRSIEDQERDCLKVVERWKLEVVEVITEIESAREPHKRPKFKQMLRELSYKNPGKRRADGLVAWHPNRLSRNAEEA